jgi:hypothetical protein
MLNLLILNNVSANKELMGRKVSLQITHQQAHRNVLYEADFGIRRSWFLLEKYLLFFYSHNTLTPNMWLLSHTKQFSSSWDDNTGNLNLTLSTVSRP